jgi:hypothetical protein
MKIATVKGNNMMIVLGSAVGIHIANIVMI